MSLVGPARRGPVLACLPFDAQGEQDAGAIKGVPSAMKEAEG